MTLTEEIQSGGQAGTGGTGGTREAGEGEGKEVE